MIQTCVYSLVLIGITLYSVRRGCNVMGCALLGLYSFISIISIVALKYKALSNANISIIPYFFLIVIFIIVFYPFLTKRQSFQVDKLKFEVNNWYLIFAWVYTLCSIITILYFIPFIKTLIAEGNWIQNRTDLYSGTLFTSYTWYEYFALQFTGYTRVLALIVGFAIIRSKAIQNLVLSRLSCV